MKLNYFIFLIPTTAAAGTPRYIPRFSAITESPSDMTSDSEFAFSMNSNDEKMIKIRGNQPLEVFLKTFDELS